MTFIVENEAPHENQLQRFSLTGDRVKAANRQTQSCRARIPSTEQIRRSKWINKFHLSIHML